MKKCIRILALTLALVLALSSTAFAADDIVADENDLATIKNPVTGATVEFATDEGNEEKINVTYTSSSLTAGNYYLVLVVASDGEGNYTTINADTITYIDQATAVQGEDGKVSISFSVYPSSLKTSVILITGMADGILKAAIVEAKYILGDVNNDGIFNIADVTLLLQYLVGLVDSNAINMQAANVDSNDAINVSDVTKMLQVLVGLEAFK